YKKHLQINLLVNFISYQSTDHIRIILTGIMMRNKENLIKKVNISKQKVLQNLPNSVSKIFNLFLL
ncbi:MAG: hypothetical protein AAFR37_25365, partial [Cyanobacteria bacterium J06628_3]